MARTLHRYTYADYVAVELDSPTKHEYFEGEIYAMSGGTGEHAALAAEVQRIMGNALVGGPCRVYTSDLRLYVEGPVSRPFPTGASSAVDWNNIHAARNPRR